MAPRVSARSSLPPADEPPAISFGAFTLDLRAAQLRRDGAPIALRPKTWAVLLHLVQHPGALVTRDELLDAVWPDVAVTLDTLTKSIGELRVALDDDARQPRFIETVHRRGFRFLDTPRPAMADAVAPPAADQPFVGRQAELDLLTGAFERACQGERQVVFIAGAAGMGKTMLLEVFLRTLASQHPAPCVGIGGSIEQHGPREAYMPVLEALDRLASGADGERVIAALRAAAPSWLAQLPWLGGDAGAGRPAARPERMLREGVALVETLARDVPLVLALEDLHWSDPSTVDLLTRIGQRREPARLLIVATYRAAEVAARDHPLASTVRALRGQRLCREVAPSELSSDGVRHYLEARFPGAAPPAPLVDALHAHTDGTPLFLRAIVDHLLARGWILDTAPGWSFAATPARLDLGVPDDVRDMVALQIASLGPADRRLLEAASVAGREATPAILAAALERTLEDVEATAETLALGERFLRPVARATPPRWTFTHELYRQAVYDGIPPARQQRLHLRVGEALETALGDRAAEAAPELATHFEHGGGVERALHYLAIAARRARHRSAPRAADEYLGEALALLERIPDPIERQRRELALRIELAPVLMERYGHASDALQRNGERALMLCEGLGDPALRFQILFALVHGAAIRGDGERLEAMENAIEALATEIGGPEHRLLADSLYARVDTYRARFADACRRAESVRRAPRGMLRQDAAAGVDPVIATINHLALASAYMGQVGRSRALMAEALERAREASPYTRASTAFFDGLVAALDRRVDAVGDASAAALALSEEYGFPLWAPMARALRGWTLVQRGELAAGLADVLAGHAAHAESGARVFTTYLYAFAAEAYLRTGDHAAGLRAVADGLRVADTTIEVSYAPELWRLKGELLFAAGRAAEAETSLGHAIELARVIEARTLEIRAAVSLARQWLAAGTAPRASGLLSDTTRGLPADVDPSDLRDARALLATLSHPTPAPGARSRRR